VQIKDANCVRETGYVGIE